MIILALDSTSSSLSVALFEDEQCLAQQRSSGRFHIESILCLIQNVLQDAQLSKSSIQLIAVNIGPGNFTSMRIGVSVARALGQFGSYPLVAVNTFDVLFFSICQLQKHEPKWTLPQHNIFITLDAKKNKVFLCHPQLTAGEIQEWIPAELAKCIDSKLGLHEKCMLIGSGAMTYLSSFEPILKDRMICPSPEYHIPDATAVAQLGRIQYLNKGGVGVSELKPLYIRKEVV